ncbi:helicase-primase subunit [Vespertilionid gammaherpesvirus 1]|uniref:Helicase-primase subunit n=1 Tax=Vespertilionid gammaherpesvirus 1 TaxID=2560830 RepID=A0A0X9XD47_9GAMA|nr:helicase-primase subunit [Myotis gammaherpesvirus 8]AMA67396.1 helicase-primase subunit [Vespertilionid gammaherpesvirus 1]
MSRTEVVCGKLMGIYFYNVHKEAKIIIWYVTYIPYPFTGPEDFVLVIGELSQDVLNTMPLDTNKPTTQELRLNCILWEQQVRLQNQWIRKLYKNQHRTLLFEKNASKILVGLKADISTNIPEAHLSGAYLFSQSNQSFNFNVSSEEKEEKNTIWYHTMIKNMSVSNIDITIKTKDGLYSCATASHRGNENYSAKQAKLDVLQITDIFRPVTHTFQWGIYTIALNLTHTNFHILWTNDDSYWNGCLVEFFRALFGKLMSGFSGLPPAYMYMFPGATPSGSYFRPYFPAFPFTKIVFGTPEKITHSQLDSSLNEKIFLHMYPFLKTYLADFILAPNICTNPLSDQCLQWPLWTCDINPNICLGEDDIFNKATVSDKHTLITVDFSQTMCRFLGVKTKDPIVFLQCILDTGSNVLVKTTTRLYSTLIATILKWSSESGFAWAAMNKCKIFVIAQDIDHFSELFQAGAVCGEPTADVWFQNHERSIFVQHCNTIFSGGLSLPNVDKMEATTWLESLNNCLSLSLLPNCTDPLSVIEMLVPLYFKHRNNVDFWLVGEDFIKCVSRPPLPIDCFKPLSYIFTQEGCMCWRNTLDNPVNIDFMFYLKSTYEFLCFVMKPGNKEKVDNKLELLQTVLCLL